MFTSMNVYSTQKTNIYFTLSIFLLICQTQLRLCLIGYDMNFSLLFSRLPIKYLVKLKSLKLDNLTLFKGRRMEEIVWIIAGFISIIRLPYVMWMAYSSNNLVSSFHCFTCFNVSWLENIVIRNCLVSTYVCMCVSRYMLCVKYSNNTFSPKRNSENPQRTFYVNLTY